MRHSDAVYTLLYITSIYDCYDCCKKYNAEWCQYVYWFLCVENNNNIMYKCI